jgi:hypothetical protein
MTGDAAGGPWLPDDFEHPTRLELATGHHLRPIRATDIDLDYPAVMGSRHRLWEIFGTAWGWPPETLNVDDDRDELARHEREIEAHESFNYAIFAEICWWVVHEMVGSDLEAVLEVVLPVWIASEWPLQHPRYIGRDLTWAEWEQQARR